VDPADERFGSVSLQHVDLLAASRSSFRLGKGPTIEIADLAGLPLLLLDSSFTLRRSFDAAARLAGLKPSIFIESHTPHTLLALAEAGHGVAVIPSQLRTRHHKVRIVGLAYLAKPVRERMLILWDRRRTLPRYASAYCEMLAAYVREVFPITRPTPVR